MTGSSSSSDESDPAASAPAARSSLDILLAQRDDNCREIARKSPNAIFLETLLRRLTGYISNHDFDNPEFQEYLTDDYTAFLEYLPEHPLCDSRKAFLARFKAHTAKNPEYTIEIESAVADVNEKNGTATVWSLINVTGEPIGLRRQSVTVHWFRRKGGKWRAYKQTGIRGMAGYL